MAYFPLYIDIREKNCVVIGGGKVAERKAGQLLEFGGRVVLIAPKVTEQISEWAKTGIIRLKQREFLAEDIMEAELVIAATDRSPVQKEAAALCREKNIPVNVVDVKELCTFFFPAIIKRDEVVAAISTGGNSPALAARLKRELEAAIPDSYGKAAKIMGAYREYIMEHVADSRIRKQIFEDMLEEILSGRDVPKKAAEEL